MNWCIENKVAFIKNFVQYLLAIGFTVDEACSMITTDPELHYMVRHARMCFMVDVNRVPATDQKELS